jgi:hypothetical protein
VRKRSWKEIKTTIVHEVAHFFGLNDEYLEELDTEIWNRSRISQPQRSSTAAHSPIWETRGLVTQSRHVFSFTSAKTILFGKRVRRICMNDLMGVG